MAKAIKPKEDIIFIIDGDKGRSNNLSSRLRLSGYATELTSSGFQAIHLIEESQIQNKLYILLIISGDMEDMPGREVLNLIRTVSPKEKLPILIMTNSQDADLAMTYIKEGANDYISSEDNYQKVLDKIEKLVSNKKKSKG